jgi:hypothetical protein
LALQHPGAGEIALFAGDITILRPEPAHVDRVPERLSII